MTTKKERAEALARMTKAELIKTVKTLDARQVKLLNEIASLKDRVAEYEYGLPPEAQWKPSLQAVNAAVNKHFDTMPWNTAATLPAVSPLDGKGDE